MRQSYCYFSIILRLVFVRIMDINLSFVLIILVKDQRGYNDVTRIRLVDRLSDQWECSSKKTIENDLIFINKQIFCVC